MTDAVSTHDRPTGGGFRHEALLYRGPRDFIERTTPFIADAVKLDEPVLVATDPGKIEALRSALPDLVGRIRFVDMQDVGRNPARIIPAWTEFVTRYGGPDRPCRGIGEPVWPGRSRDELVECERHESLLNLAFADAPPFWLLCPYDAAALEPHVLRRVGTTHPSLTDAGSGVRTDPYRGPSAAREPCVDALPPPVDADEMVFGGTDLATVRRFVAEHSGRLEPMRRNDLVCAVNELAANSIRYGGGTGTVRVWHDARAVICEVVDTGWIADPLAGRVRPVPTGGTGYGLWLVNRVCDLTQVRSSAAGTVVRVHVCIAPR